MALDAILHTDPGCPWGYSANPDLAVLRWRYGDGLRFRLVMIGLAEGPDRYVRAGYTAVRMAQGHRGFGRRFGMPVGTAPKPHVTGTGRACRAVVATRLTDPRHEWAVLRALQFSWFTSDALVDEDDDALREALGGVPGLDAAAVVDAIGAPETEAAYQEDRALARTAAGSPTEAQGKSANSDGAERYTAPSLQLAAGDGRTLEAGGFQSLAAYDVLVANLEPGLERRAAPASALDAVAAFDHGLTTQEVAAVLTSGLDETDRAGTEAELLELTGAGRVHRVPLGDDALWRVAA